MVLPTDEETRTEPDFGHFDVINDTLTIPSEYSIFFRHTV